MKSTTKHGILWLMIFSFIFQAKSQNFEETIQFADKQFELKNYQLAVKEYQRALFFSDGGQFDYLYQQIAHSFYINNQFEQALYFYDLSYKTAKNDSIKFERIFNRSLCYLKTSKFKQSIQELLNLPDSLSSHFNDRRNFYFAVSYFGLEDFKKSENYFLACLNNTDKNAKTEIENLFGRKRNLNKPNPKTAKTLSMILPGTGQIYAGDVKNSLNSILLTGSFVMLAVVMAQQYSILDAVLTALPWFTRYYKGGYASAKKIAHNKRAIRRDKTYKEVLDIISESKNIE